MKKLAMLIKWEGHFVFPMSITVTLANRKHYCELVYEEEGRRHFVTQRHDMMQREHLVNFRIKTNIGIILRIKIQTQTTMYDLFSHFCAERWLQK